MNKYASHPGWMLGLAGVALLLGSAAYAEPVGKIDICHKPGEHNQRILSINEQSIEDHFGHGDYEVTPPQCDAIADNDCDGVPDDPLLDDADCVAQLGEGATCASGECVPPPDTCPCDYATNIQTYVRNEGDLTSWDRCGVIEGDVIISTDLTSVPRGGPLRLILLTDSDSQGTGAPICDSSVEVCPDTDPDTGLCLWSDIGDVRITNITESDLTVCSALVESLCSTGP